MASLHRRTSASLDRLCAVRVRRDVPLADPAALSPDRPVQRRESTGQPARLDVSRALTATEWERVRSFADGLEWSHGWADATWRMRFLLDFGYATGLCASELVVASPWRYRNRRTRRALATSDRQEGQTEQGRLAGVGAICARSVSRAARAVGHPGALADGYAANRQSRWFAVHYAAAIPALPERGRIDPGRSPGAGRQVAACHAALDVTLARHTGTGQRCDADHCTRQPAPYLDRDDVGLSERR